MSPDELLRLDFRAKDENRPHLLADVFTDDARLEISNRSDQISFPGHYRRAGGAQARSPSPCRARR